MCELRFANMYMVISRLVRIEERVKFVAVSTAFAEWISALPKKADRTQNLEIQATISLLSLWILTKEYLSLMSPVYSLLREVDRNTCMIGKVYKQMSDIQDTFEAKSTTWLNEEDLEGLKQAWVSRWNYSHCDLFAAGL